MQGKVATTSVRPGIIATLLSKISLICWGRVHTSRTPTRNATSATRGCTSPTASPRSSSDPIRTCKTASMVSFSALVCRLVLKSNPLYNNRSHNRCDVQSIYYTYLALPVHEHPGLQAGMEVSFFLLNSCHCQRPNAHGPTNIIFTLSVYTFDEGLASRVPYESAARTLTQRKQVRFCDSVFFMAH